MPSWIKTNRVALIGVLGSLLFGGLEVVAYLFNGVSEADRNMPIGVLLSNLASLLAEPPSAVSAGADQRALAQTLIIGWQVLLTLCFAAVLWAGSRLQRPSRLADCLLGLQMFLAALGASALLYVLAAQLAVVLPLRRGLKWLAVQGLLMIASFIYISFFRGLAPGDPIILTFAMHLFMGLSFQGIAFASARAAVAERAMRLQLAAANASLLATQSMLADTVRSSERNRIARDLHDAVGHHLTALNLHLDLALRQAGAGAPEPLRTSRELARSLLAEVREVVSTERSDQHVDLGAAIATLCAGVPQPAVRLHVDDDLAIASPALAHTLFFCTQEALTNAMRHAEASLVTIELRATRDCITLQVGDNGHGSGAASEGNGLRGMRERVAEQGGTLQAGDRPAGGYGISIALPLRSAA